MTYETQAAYDSWIAADDAFHTELVRQFGPVRAGEVRYTTKGRGLPGSRLHKLYTACAKASAAYRAVSLAAAE